MPTPPPATATPGTRRLTVNGTRLAVQERPGDEPVLLLHPGFVADGLAPLLAEPTLGAYRLVGYHRRGYGNSDRAIGPVSVAEQAADALAVLDALGVDRAHLVGHSVGANVAVEAALTAPQRVATLALLEPLLGFAVAPATAQVVLDTAAEAYRRLGEGDPAGAVDTWLEAAFDPGYRDVLEAALPGAFEQAVRDADAPFGVEVPSLQDWPRGPDDLRRLSQPALSVRGADGTWPGFRETHQALLAWLPDGEGLIVPGATHLLQLADPRAVAEGLAAFLARHRLR
jgi:pimeloyl-ACP methyl ester carboxylesterase